MNLRLLVLFLVYFLCGCKAQKPDSKNLEKNGRLVLSMERTACFGRCPIYQIKLYQNGLLVYNAEQFTDTVGCFYSVLTKPEIAVIEEKLKQANFFGLADSYPVGVQTPTDLPSCIVFYNKNGRQKTVTDKRFKSPEMLTYIENSIDSLVNTRKLQICDK